MRTRKRRRKLYLKISVGLIVILFVYFIINSFSNSLFVNKRSKMLTIVFYQKYPVVYFLDFSTSMFYRTVLNPDWRVMVPGDYGYYRIGALQKLMSLEGKKDILKNTFSYIDNSMVDYYFYPRKVDVYYSSSSSNLSKVKSPKFIFMKSNTSFFNKFYIWLFLLRKTNQDFINIEYPTYRDKVGDLYLDVDKFSKKTKGMFYDVSYRKDNKDVQIIYTNSYNSAVVIASILEGSGIRVIDISKGEKKRSGEERSKCVLIDSSMSLSYTAKSLASFFDCKIKHGKTRISDIILLLNDQEKSWVKNNTN